jgi:hypothetical protein
MNKCIDSEIQEMLPDLLHGSLGEQPRRQVEAHLAGCESCREDLNVIRAVKSAAVFAPVIDVGQVVRRIPPYRTIVPGVQKPARTKIVQWLVAAGLLVVAVGGGSLVISNQFRTAAAPAMSTGNGAETQPPAISVSPVVVPKQTPLEASPTRTHALALATNLDDLSDGSLVQLMNDMDRFDALPAAEPEPVIAVDSGDTL